MKKTFIILLSSLFVASANAHKKQPAKVQIALLLDTSNSMDGLIQQTKTQLWKVVNTFTESKKNGQVPFVEVALYEYGNQGLKPAQNFIRQVQPLTRDLDQLSEDLFSLKTNGGDEYCGAVIERAVKDLKWDPAGDTYKAIFIAGNEPFTQGPVSSLIACKDAIERGVVVNTIHCGANQAGLSGGWNQGALLAEGDYMVINQDSAVTHVAAPQDSEILRLNKRLNGTYIPYGKHGSARKKNQIQQDANAIAHAKSGAAVQRAITKGSKVYHNAKWDLCDASFKPGFDWSKLKKEDLPAELKSLSAEARQKYVETQIAERKAIQSEIQKLNVARQNYVAEKLLGKSQLGSQTLDQVVTKTVREQAEKKGYQFKGK